MLCVSCGMPSDTFRCNSCWDTYANHAMKKKMSTLLQQEYQKRVDKGYTQDQLKLWWSGIATAWRLLQGHPPPEIFEETDGKLRS